MNKLYNHCTLCPRQCGVDRSIKNGYCKASNKLVVARAALHMWEEPCISGKSGSGTVFFSGCPLGCIYCQNYQIRDNLTGKEIDAKRLAEIFINLQQQGANNINLVTPTHFVPHIISAIDIARKDGLVLPILYNCGGYERTETLKLLEGYVDIYLPDFKYMSARTAAAYSHAPDYTEVAKAALAEMFRQVGKPVFNKDGIIKKGLIVRHLLLPGHESESEEIVKYLYCTYKDDIFISLMNQYTPLPHIKDVCPLNRRVTNDEYERLIDFAVDLGVVNGFVQEGETSSESFIPSFDNTGV